MKIRSHRQSERGTTVAEFAVVALLFFTLIFGIIEFGRLLYTHNALTDATRRGARFAVLHQGLTDGDKTAVKNEVVYGPNGTFDDKGNATSPPLINGLTTDMVEVNFEGVDIDGDPDTPEKTAFGTNLGMATVKIKDYKFFLSIPVIGRTLTLPTYETTLTAESAGEIPDPI
ncbi:MAG TPA: TadE/TadG family type IV pilus assembly protein [Pyrinomonadaceae bacterium]